MSVKDGPIKVKRISETHWRYISFPYKLRAKGPELFIYKGMEICSRYCPEFDNGRIYLPGRNIEEDNELLFVPTEYTDEFLECIEMFNKTLVNKYDRIKIYAKRLP